MKSKQVKLSLVPQVKILLEAKYAQPTVKICKYLERFKKNLNSIPPQNHHSHTHNQKETPPYRKWDKNFYFYTRYIFNALG